MATELSMKWKKREKSVKKTDPILDPLPTDIIIPIMGPTGSGKSTLINLLTGRQAVIVGNQLESCTIDLQPVVIQAKDWADPMGDDTPRRLILVDTPGLDDTYVDDSEVLRRISVWLAASYNNSMKVAGVIFLHEISQVRMWGTTRRDTAVFKTFCGEDIIKFVALCTTIWEEVPPDLAKAREDQLKATYWTDMVSGGAQVMRIHREGNSAWEVVNAILTRHQDGFDRSTTMNIQEPMDPQKSLAETDDGRSLQASPERKFEEQRETIQEIDASAEPGPSQEQQKQRDETKKTLAQTSNLNTDGTSPIVMT